MQSLPRPVKRQKAMKSLYFIGITYVASRCTVKHSIAGDCACNLISNQIDIAVLPLNLALPPYREGSVRIFGTSERERSPLAPDLPSLADNPELKAVNMTVWYGLFAPAGVDLAIGERIYNDLAVTLRDPDMRAKLAQVHLVSVVGSTPRELAVFLGQEIERYSAIVKAANIKAE
jgi:tripartite-type tricarboxylate transporter receptor subunit TctC